MKNKPKIYFRADGNAEIGLGHVIRSLALVEMVKDHFHCTFMIQNPSPSIQNKINAVCDDMISLHSSKDLVSEAKMIADQWVDEGTIIVLDGYGFDTEYQKILKSENIKIVCIDDINAYHFVADVVINHAGGFTKDEYSVAAYSKVFLGPEYALLREPFRLVNRNNSKIQKIDAVFICLGGADPNNDTLEVVKFCLSCQPKLKYQIVIGSAYRHQAVLYDFIKDNQLDATISINLSALEMAEVMMKCPVAICSPSTTCYEYLSIGGLLFLKQIAENQTRLKSYLITEKLAFDVSSFAEVKAIMRNPSVADSPFDGKQHKRFLKIFYALILQLEKSTIHDMELYYNWANDPETRKQSFNHEKIKWEDHQNWFITRINSNSHIFYKAIIEKTPVGQVRYDIKDQSVIINYSVDSAYRGQGIGAMLLEKSIKLIQKKDTQYKEIIGFVKMTNLGSVKVFRKLGFMEETAHEFPNTYKYVLKCQM